MFPSKVKESICLNDMPEGCECDNCTSGRAPLAKAVLNLIELVNRLHNSNKEIGDNNHEILTKLYNL